MLQRQIFPRGLDKKYGGLHVKVELALQPEKIANFSPNGAAYTETKEKKVTWRRLGVATKSLRVVSGVGLRLKTTMNF